jgi:hypothetical protein
MLAFRLLNPFGSRVKRAHAPQVHSYVDIMKGSRRHTGG